MARDELEGSGERSEDCEMIVWRAVSVQERDLPLIRPGDGECDVSNVAKDC